MATLVAYFSAEGTTAKVAKEFAERTGADIFEIVPQDAYTKADIRYMNPLARCNREQMGGKDVHFERLSPCMVQSSYRPSLSSHLPSCYPQNP